MSIPEWAQNEESIDEAKNYLRQGNLVDFFELVSSSILREHPTDLAAFCLELVQKVMDGKEASAHGDGYAKKVGDNRYVREKNICDFLNEWILALLKERPIADSDRMEFHKRYLESVISGRGDTKNDAGCVTEKELESEKDEAQGTEKE